MISNLKDVLLGIYRSKSTSQGYCLALILAITFLPTSVLAETHTHILKNNQWELLNFPTQSNTQSFSSILEDNLPLEDYEKTWIIYQFSPVTNEYSVPAILQSPGIGESYWIVQETGSDIEIDITDEISVNNPTVVTSPECTPTINCIPTFPVSVMGKNYWSTMGTSMAGARRLSDFRVKTTGLAACSSGCTLEKAYAEDFSQNLVYVYDGGIDHYLPKGDGDSIEKWQGFWFNSLPSSGPIVLLVPSETELAPALLSGLTVDGAKTGLNPEFSPNVFRYSIIANTDLTQLSLTPSSTDSVLISINGQLTNSGATTALGNLQPGNTVEILVESEDSSTSNLYEVLYMPTDFPELVVSVLEDGVSTDPLYITIIFGSTGRYIANLDNNGVPTFYRKINARAFDYKFHQTTNERSFARRLESMNVWGRNNAEIVVLDDDFNDAEVFTTVGLSHTDFHDFLILPSNELVLLSYDGVVKDLSDIGLSTEEVVEESVIQIVDRATQQVTFEWRSLEEIPFEEQLYDPLRNEYAHINSVIVDTDGNLIASLRGTSNIIKIDRTSGRVLWKMGGKSNEFTFTNDPFTGPCGQHTATRLENGNLLVFDNGQQCLPQDNRGNQTRIVEYQVDEANLTAELVWDYQQADQYTTSMGSAQRLNNGNTLIGWGRRAAPAPPTLVTEVDAEGNSLFELSTTSDVPVLIYRAFRFRE